jgi:hypothetical protein
MNGRLHADRRIKIISGAYGAGKTEFAVNYALKLAERGRETVLVDLDIANPSLTSRGIRVFLAERSVTVLEPVPEHTLVDIPALPAEIFSVLTNPNAEVLIDLEGDVPGYLYPHLLKSGYDLFYLVNVNRPDTGDLEGALELFETCERATRLKITKLVNSTHLLFDTSAEDILAGHEVCRRLAACKQVELAYNVVWREIAERESFPELEGELFSIDMNLRPRCLDEGPTPGGAVARARDDLLLYYPLGCFWDVYQEGLQNA